MLALDKDLSILRIRYQVEETRFTLWGQCWGWSENESAFNFESSGSGLDEILKIPQMQQLIEDVLGQIEDLLKQLQKIFKRYAPEREPHSDVSESSQTALARPSNTASPSTFRRFRAKLRWAVDEKLSSKEVLEHLESLNESLLPRSERKKLANALPSEMLVQEDYIASDEKREQVVAAMEASTGHAGNSSSQTLQGEGHETPAGTQREATSESQTMELPIQWFKDLDLDPNRSGRTMEIVSIPNNHRQIPEQGPPSDSGNSSMINDGDRTDDSESQVVLVEWKLYKDTIDSEQLQMALDARKEQISRHLFRRHDASDNGHNYVLPCLGYVVLNEETMGLVFTPPSGCTRLPQTLNQVLEADFESLSAIAPSLDVRVSLAKKIASALYQLQCAGWLHRQISSHNILFFHSPTASSETTALDLSQPYLAGWQSSRHDDREADEASVGISRWRKYPYLWIEYAYMHPRRPQTRFRRSYDVYSLGVVLAEIAFWAHWRS